MISLFLAPHPDDEVLFGCFTLIREKPLILICSDSYVQQNRGENITPQQRFQESVSAAKLLNCSIQRTGIRDDIISELALIEKLACFKNFDKVYAPALQGGNPVHDMVALASEKVFKSHPGVELIQYSTYKRGEWKSVGTKEVKPTEEEMKTKLYALTCYKSQIELPSTTQHFEAARKGSEWYL